jgi:phospholipase/lecithinase/hemolysin
VSGGANDYFQFHDFRQPGFVAVSDNPRLSYAAIAGRAARSVARAARRLSELGARQIIVFNAYALEATPWAASIEPQQAQALSFAGGYDAALGLEIDRLRAEAPALKVFPVGAHMRAILADAARFGISDTQHACQPVLPVPGPRRGPAAQFFWWDECHPTARVHELLGQSLAELVAPN